MRANTGNEEGKKDEVRQYSPHYPPSFPKHPVTTQQKPQTFTSWPGKKNGATMSSKAGCLTREEGKEGWRREEVHFRAQNIFYPPPSFPPSVLPYLQLPHRLGHHMHILKIKCRGHALIGRIPKMVRHNLNKQGLGW